MDEIVKVCTKHGPLTIEKVQKSSDKNLKLGYSYRCKECRYEGNRRRPCPIHGDISLDERVPSGHCRLCSIAKALKANEKRNNNRDWFNARAKLKRDADPEKTANDYKLRYQRDLERKGNIQLNIENKERRLNLNSGDLKKMMDAQENKCAICNRPETRIFGQRGDRKGEMKIASLCIDHCHVTGKVRELLCHNCNTGIGKFNDDIELMKSAIKYLEKHSDASP